MFEKVVRFSNISWSVFHLTNTSGGGTYVVKNGEYYKVDKKEKIQKNHTVDREKEDERNISNIMAKKYSMQKNDIEEIMKEFMINESKENGVVVYTGYDKQKDEYYIDYYMEGSFEEREIVNKKDAEGMGVGSFSTMGRDEFDNYDEFFDAYELVEKLDDVIKKYISNK